MMDASASAARRFPIRSWLQTMAMMVLAMTAIVALKNHQPTYEEKTAAFIIDGKAGVRQDARGFSVHMAPSAITLARAYRVPGAHVADPPRRFETTGIWLSLVVDVDIAQSPGLVSAQLVTRDGLVFPATAHDRPPLRNVNLSNVVLAPGLPRKGAYFFELPPDRLQGLRVQFFRGSGVPDEWDDLVEFDLGLDAVRVADALARAKPEIDLAAP